MPAPGLKVGFATFGKLIVYFAEAVLLSLHPLKNALAFIVVVLLIKIGSR